MMRNSAAMKALVFWSALVLSACPVLGAAPPNVVVILTDDMGFSDLGCQGGEIKTPHLDGLAAEGLQFTRFYNTARCCPTRAALLTGRYSHAAGVGHMMEDRKIPGYRGDLSRDVPTVAEALRPAGYRNYAVGKWHVTRHVQAQGPKHNWPLQRGFDRFYGTIHGAGSFFDPSTLTRNNQQISAHADPEYQPKVYYYTDAIADHAVRFITEHKRDHAEKPFFLYVAFTAAHWPMHALPEDIAKYEKYYGNGYDAVRRERFRKASGLGLIAAEQGLAPTAEDWESVPMERRAWEQRCMQVYAAMVHRMDAGVGRITAGLRKAGMFENTVIFYMQDNGGCAENQGRSPTDGHPNIARPAGPTLAPLAADQLLPPGSVPPQTRDGYPVRMGDRVMPGAGDTYVAYGRGWANVSNTPFREYKHWVHEGGISSPLIIHWPKGVDPKQRGQIVKEPGHLIDIAATAIDLAGITAAARPVLDGVSLRPVLQGQPLVREQPLFWEHEGNRAAAQGRWKLVAKFRQPWELYDLETDRVELHNRAKEHPEIVEKLQTLWNDWAGRNHVVLWETLVPARRNRQPGKN